MCNVHFCTVYYCSYSQKFRRIQFSWKDTLQRFCDQIFAHGCTCSRIKNVRLGFYFCGFNFFVVCHSTVKTAKILDPSTLSGHNYRVMYAQSYSYSIYWVMKKRSLCAPYLKNSSIDKHLTLRDFISPLPVKVSNGRWSIYTYLSLIGFP